MRDHKRRRALVLAAISCVPLSVIVMASPAAAHEQRDFAGVHAEVGWGIEPTYAGFQNSVQLILTDTNDQPVTDLGDTLNVAVTSGNQTTTLPVVPDFSLGPDVSGDPGDYRAWIVPTRPGTYSFHFTGTIHGQAVDETFTSSETTFDDVADPTAIEVPAKDPTIGQLADKVDRDTARLTDATNAAQKAKDEVSSARLIAIAGVVIGVAGLVIGLVALRRRSTA
jgi:hypothetical protein